MRRSLLFFVLLGCQAAGLVRPAAAQVTLGADALVASAYVWRGLSLANRPLVQPDVYLVAPLARGELLLTAWANLEPARYAGAGDLSMNGPDGAALTEWNLVAEYSRAAGPLAVTLGGILVRYPNARGYTAASNSGEVFARATLPRLPLAPRVGVHYDVDAVRGLYLEAGLSREFGAAPAFRAHLLTEHRSCAIRFSVLPFAESSEFQVLSTTWTTPSLSTPQCPPACIHLPKNSSPQSEQARSSPNAFLPPHTAHRVPAGSATPCV